MIVMVKHITIFYYKNISLKFLLATISFFQRKPIKLKLKKKEMFVSKFKVSLMLFIVKKFIHFKFLLI